VQLQSALPDFRAAGIDIVAMTYDAPTLQQQFISKFNITYPLLSDVAATSVKRLGILNGDYAPGDANYGIPHPGVFILDREQKIVGKIFVEAYSTRVDAAGVLAYAKRVLHVEAPEQES
jgi:peroxiredoxin